MMRKGWLAIGGAAAALLAGAAAAQDRAEASAEATLVVTEPRLVEGTMELVATGYTFTEGPAWDGTRLIFSDIPGNAVHVHIPGQSGAKQLYAPSMNANGHTFDRAGRLLNAEHGSGALTRWTPEGGRQVIVERFEGKHLNSPNDVVVRGDGLIFFTDPPYGLGKRAAEIAFSGVFALDEASGRMVLIDDAHARPNGLAFSPDEAVLYVGDTATQSLWAYDIAADGSASGKRLVIDLKVEGLVGNVDGVRVDAEGLVYLTCPGGICVVDPARGTLLERMAVPKRATNLAWGGPELSDLYITAQSDVYRVKTRTRGTGSSSRR
ncbi:SMP-30/gluconolactonase/LRE family protein [Erythrobacter sp. CCH5-A1]|jgi:gluconolactonase|uniref:SMP-30/gluconolactonase/LRE family protein n=1 Tax=Erythrobacter sp. CCH5-A1 TaxID=1768792 RepID=UPI00083618FD|nr:SMP-30/gluconolactonase/LRE family protein [Erythrobacter sp. CCH5-A1]